MPIEIKSPYVNTPYDVFSDPDDPKVGVLTPDASRDQVLQQQVKLLKQHKKDVRTINEASDLLKKGASRLSWDIFLTTTLTRSTDLGDLVEQYKQPQLPVLKDPDWGAELSWSYQSPEDNIELFETSTNRLSTYDIPPVQTSEFTFEA
jgi:hypothetical protein